MSTTPSNPVQSCQPSTTELLARENDAEMARLTGLIFDEINKNKSLTARVEDLEKALREAHRQLKGPHYQGGTSLVAIGNAYSVIDAVLQPKGAQELRCARAETSELNGKIRMPIELIVHCEAILSKLASAPAGNAGVRTWDMALADRVMQLRDAGCSSLSCTQVLGLIAFVRDGEGEAFADEIKRADAAPPEASFDNASDMLGYLNAPREAEPVLDEDEIDASGAPHSGIRRHSPSYPVSASNHVCSLCLGTGKVFHENPPRKDTPYSRCHCQQVVAPQPVASAQDEQQPVAWQFRQRSGVGKGPQSHAPWGDWCGIEKEDYDNYIRRPNKLIEVRALCASTVSSTEGK